MTIRDDMNYIETKKPIEDINRTEGGLFVKKNESNKFLPRLKKKGRGLTSIKLETKKKLKMTPQKYKGSRETTTSNYMPIKWKT